MADIGHRHQFRACPHLARHPFRRRRAQQVRPAATQQQGRNALKRRHHRPHVDARLAARRAQRLGDAHVIIEHDASAAVQPIEPLGHRQPLLQPIGRIDIAIGFLQREGRMDPARVRLAHTHIAANPVQPRLVQRRADIVQHRARQPFAMGGGDEHGDDPAQRRADRHEAGDRQVRQQPADILQIGQRHIAHRILGIGAFRAPPHIRADHPPLARQPLCQRLEIARIAGQPWQAQHGRSPVLAARIVAIMQPQSIRGPPICVTIAGQA